MENSLPLPDSKKIIVTFRVEAGCLGPKGDSLVSDFCVFAQENLGSLDSDYVIWCVEPRNDKTLPELQYSVFGKKITHSQAEKYLDVFDQYLDEFEGHLENKLANLIDVFMAKQIGS